MVLALLVLLVLLNPLVGIVAVTAVFAAVGATEAVVGRVADRVRGSPAPAIPDLPSRAVTPPPRPRRRP